MRVAAFACAAHLLFCAARLPHAVYGKRIGEITDWSELGAAAYHLQMAGAESRRVLEWLAQELPPGQVLLWNGDSRGYLQVAAAVLAPRLLVWDRAVAPMASIAAGRPIFRGRAPWHQQVPVDAVPVLVGRTPAAAGLELTYR
ncbi:MAG: hypothetical protein AAF628_05605 [Planctomycetota bacterium]